jgi:hypothetical protein
MEATQAPYRLKSKIGVNEFDADGPEKVVKEQYQLFLQAIQTLPQVPQNNGSAGTNGYTAPNNTAPPTDEDIEATWNRAYLRKDNKLSLHVLPKTKTAAADTLVLLMYGFQKLFGLEAVSSIALMEAAKQSGLRIDRVDRSLPTEHAKLVIRGGQGKGTRYSVNNRGAAYAQDLLEKLFE